MLVLEMKFRSEDGGKDGEYAGGDYEKKSSMFSTHDAIFGGTEILGEYKCSDLG